MIRHIHIHDHRTKDAYNMISKCREEGMKAGSEGKPRSDNPYKEGTDAAWSWSQGYNIAKYVQRPSRDASVLGSVIKCDVGWKVCVAVRGEHREIVIPFSEAPTSKEALARGMAEAKRMEGVTDAESAGSYSGVTIYKDTDGKYYIINQQGKKDFISATVAQVKAKLQKEENSGY